MLMIMIMIMLMLTHLSTCRIITSEEANKLAADRNEFYTRFSWHSSAAQALDGSRNFEKDPIRGVSLRAVPDGPNPLHN